MSRRSLIRRTLLTFFGATMLTSLLSAAIVSWWAPRPLVDQTRKALEEHARTVAHQLEGLTLRQARRQLDLLTSDSASHWELLADTGLVHTAGAASASSGSGDTLAIEIPLPAPIDRATVLRVIRPVRSGLVESRMIILVGAVSSAALAFCLFLVSAERLVSPLFVELERLEDMRRDFVANVSHELKTPLTASQGMVETMIDDPEMDAETRVLFLSKVRDQTQRLSALVSDLLALSRIEADPRSLDSSRMDLRDVIEECIGAFWGNIESKHLEIVRSLPEEEILFDGDRESIAAAIGNLLDNAIKYSPNNSSMRVTLETREGLAYISVEDQGSGIPEDHLDRIFERFYRVDAARSKALGGTGLGLSIVKHIALAHGGDVTVESAVGSGSTFGFTLPLDA